MTHTFTIDTIRDAFKQNEVLFREIYEHLHRHPELSRHEEKTAAFLIEQIQMHTDFTLLERVQTGFLAGREDTPPPKLCLRADLDALAISEETGVVFASRQKGVMHACAHDFHSTAVFAVAFLWNKLFADKAKAPLFLWQHAEESIPGGALDFLAGTALAEITEIFGFHVEPSLPVGTLSLTEGWVNARSIRFDISLTGGGGHSARPWTGRDPIIAAIELINLLYSRIPRLHDVRQPVLFSVTGINSKQGPYNALNEEIHLTATLRLSSLVGEEAIIDFIYEQARASSERHGLQVEIHHEAGAPPVWNRSESIQTASSLLTQLTGRGWKKADYRSLGGDDFGWFSQRLPGFYARFGVAPEGNHDMQLHSSTFLPEWAALEYIVTFFVAYFNQRLSAASTADG
jgi:amidohydrolase